MRFGRIGRVLGLLPVAASMAAAPPRLDARPGPVALARAAAADGFHDVAEQWWKAAWSNAASAEERTACEAGLAEARLGAGRAREALAGLLPLTAPGVRAEPALLWWRAVAERAAGDGAAAERTLLRLNVGGLPAEWKERVWRLYADLLWDRGQTDESLAALDAAIGAAAAAAALRHGVILARRLDELGDRPLAIERLAALLRNAPAAVESAAAELQLVQMEIGNGGGARAAEAARRLAGDAGLTASDRARAWLLVARVEEARTNLAAAASALDAAVRCGERTAAEPDVLFARAGFRARTGDLDAAQDALQDALRRHPRHPTGVELELDMAFRLHDAGRLDAALSAYQAFLQIAPEDAARRPLALLGKGWCLVEAHRPGEAVATLDKAAEGLPVRERRREAELKAADALLASGQHAAAADRYDAFRAADPDDPRSLTAAYLAAEAIARMGQVAEAIARFREVETRGGSDPLAVRAALRRARLHEDAREFEAAQTVYEDILSRYPGAPEARTARLGRALLLYRRVECEAALADFSSLAAADPPDAAAEQADAMRAWCLYLLEREAEAVEACRAFLKRFPASDHAPAAQFWLAEFAWNHADPESAEREFVALADRWPASPLADAALYRAGRAAAAAREFLRALSHFNRFAATYPSSPLLPDARFAQGDALAELGRFDAALLSFEEVVRSAPDSLAAALAWGRKGDCHFTLGAGMPARYEEAAGSYRAVVDHPRSPTDLRLQALYKIGRCREMSARTADALENYLAVVYQHAEERRDGRAGAPVWFVRAAFGAAAIQERAEKWREAVQIYRRVVEDGGPSAGDAAAQIRRIQAAHWEVF